MAHSKQYEEYINSDVWRLVRDYMIILREKKCERCPATDDLQVHHKTYDRLGCEKIPEDLEVLCRPCHLWADREREERTQERRFNAGLETYASKKYGDLWIYEQDYDEISAEFAEWLDDKEDAD